VTGVDDPEAGDAVEILLAMDVPDGRVLAAREDLQPLLRGDVGPRLGMNPHMLERVLLDRLR
jgi:hypothetical protein